LFLFKIEQQKGSAGFNRLAFFFKQKRYRSSPKKNIEGNTA